MPLTRAESTAGRVTARTQTSVRWLHSLKPWDKEQLGQAWQRPETLMLRRLSWEDHEFEANLDYITGG